MKKAVRPILSALAILTALVLGLAQNSCGAKVGGALHGLQVLVGVVASDEDKQAAERAAEEAKKDVLVMKSKRATLVTPTPTP